MIFYMEVEVLLVMFQHIRVAHRDHGIVQIESQLEILQVIELDSVAFFHELN